jgi:lipid II:glycine glycyltransferase (peptidoglycan interpeptide bridge formation enzyme)
MGGNARDCKEKQGRLPTPTCVSDQHGAVLASHRVFGTRAGVAEGDWDSALRSLGGHFLQSTAWQRVQAALGHEVIRDQGDGWLWAGAIRSGRFPRYVYIPYGPTARSGQSTEALQRSVQLARKHHLDFVRAEPVGHDTEEALRHTAAVPSRAIQPRWTWILDLTPDETALHRGLSAGHRGNVNAASRRNIQIRSSRDPAEIEVFLALHEKAQHRPGFRGQSQRYHRTVAEILMPLGAAALYIAEVAGTAVAAATCFDFADTRYYAHAASDPEAGRRLGAAAPLVWSMILDARAEGRQRFDFWGVLPVDEPAHPWSGLTQFKKAFGGEFVERWGTWDLPVHPLRHRLYRAALLLRR